jgi:acyl-CoA reductase-like NAD-dependent aldehyde dehydrogenase/nicotinamidase-related amidase
MRSCLLLIDLQNDFLARPGLVPPAAELIDQIAILLKEWRKLGLPVMHVHTLVSTDGQNRMPHWKAQNIWSCVEGSFGAKAPVKLTPLASEQVFVKQYFSGFSHGHLLSSLQANNIDTLVIAGAYTHACVRATIVDAYQHGFRIWAADDGVGSDSPDHDQITRDYLNQRCCEFIDTKEILARLCLSVHFPLASIVDRKLPSFLLNNTWHPSSSTASWAHRTPTNHKEITFYFTPCNQIEINRAVTAATKALPAWSASDVSNKQAILASWKAVIEHRREDFISCLTLEIGKPLFDAQQEFNYALQLLDACIDRDQNLIHKPKYDNGMVDIRHCPLGCVGIITPWNNSLAIPVGKLAPALLYGNSVVWKPAPSASGVAMLLMDSLMACGLPANVLNIIFGGADTGVALALSDGLAALSFTGSIAAGRQLAMICAGKGIPLQAELGGNNGVIVTRHCQVAEVATVLADSVFSFSGQRCTAPRRLIVERSILDEFTSAFINRASELKIGFPQDITTKIGPLLSEDRQQTMTEIVANALAAGARLLYGGGIPTGFESGCWFEPTVLLSDSCLDQVVREESFGPIAVILPVDNFEEALVVCNDVEHGLVATLCSDYPQQQLRFMQTIEAGILRLGVANMFIHPEAPFGGWKASTIGYPEHGRWDQDFYTRPQALYGFGNVSTFPII